MTFKFQCTQKFHSLETNSIDPADLRLPLSNKVRTNNTRVLRYLKIIDYINSFHACDIMRHTNSIEHTHYDKTAKTFSRIDFIFSYIDELSMKIETITTSFSDHKMLHSYETTCDDHGSSYWKLNEQILKDKSKIKSIVEFHSNLMTEPNSIDEYEMFKTRIQTNESKNRT